MLQELSMVEQRYQAVLEALESEASISEVAIRYGVNRRTLHRWLVRYAPGAPGAPAGRSSKPDRCPHQIAPEVEARIVSLATRPSRLGAAHDPQPAAPGARGTAVEVCDLPRPGAPRLDRAEEGRRRRVDYRPWERSRAMELWQMDVMGEVFLSDGTELKVGKVFTGKLGRKPAIVLFDRICHENGIRCCAKATERVSWG